MVSASAVVSAVRVLVLFAESYSRVATERSADARLLELCRDEDSAASSSKFREACVRARSDGAAPLILKAFLVAVHHCFLDFVELFNSPSRVLLLFLFVLSGVSAPVLRVVVSTFLAGVRTRAGDEHSDDEEENRTVLLIGGPDPLRRGRWDTVRRKIGHAMLPPGYDEFHDAKEHWD